MLGYARSKPFHLLVSRTGAFAVAAALQGVCALGLVLVASRVLSVSDLATWALLEATFTFAPGLLTLGAQHQLLRCRPQSVEGWSRTPKLLAHGATAATVAFACLISLPLSISLGALTGVLAAANLLLDGVGLVEQFRSRAVLDAKAFARVTAGRSIIFICLASAMMAMLGSIALWMLLSARLLATAVAVSGSKPYWAKRDRLPGNLRRFAVGMRYGFPIAIATGALMAGDAIERGVLFTLESKANIAQYYVHSRMSAAVGLLVLTPAMLVFPNIRRRVLDMDARRQHGILSGVQLSVLVLGALLIVALLISSNQLVGIIAPGVSADRLLLLMLAAGVLFKGVATLFGIGLFSSGGSKKALIGALLSVAISVVAGIPFVKVFGVRGMAAAALMAGSFYLVWIAGHSHSVRRVGIGIVPLSIGVMAFLLTAAGAIAGGWR